MPTATRERPKFTPETARTFDRFSIANAAQAMRDLQEAGCCRGACQPYEDIYTFNRWAAQGYYVRKGQHGAKLSIIIENTKEDEEGNKTAVSRPWMTTVFCRCQVEVKEAAPARLQLVGAK